MLHNEYRIPRRERDRYLCAQDFGKAGGSRERGNSKSVVVTVKIGKEMCVCVGYRGKGGRDMGKRLFLVA